MEYSVERYYSKNNEVLMPTWRIASWSVLILQGVAYQDDNQGARDIPHVHLPHCLPWVEGSRVDNFSIFLPVCFGPTSSNRFLYKDLVKKHFEDVEKVEQVKIPIEDTKKFAQVKSTLFKCCIINNWHILMVDGCGWWLCWRWSMLMVTNEQVPDMWKWFTDEDGFVEKLYEEDWSASS